jgi:serine/threonine protein kinase
MASVYLARDLKHDRLVPVKAPRPEVAAALGGERFLEEIRITARLDYPHILTLIDSGEADGFLYYVLFARHWMYDPVRGDPRFPAPLESAER